MGRGAQGHWMKPRKESNK